MDIVLQVLLVESVSFLSALSSRIPYLKRYRYDQKYLTTNSNKIHMENSGLILLASTIRRQQRNATTKVL